LKIFWNWNMSWKWNNKCVYLRSKWIQLGETDCLYDLVKNGGNWMVCQVFHFSLSYMSHTSLLPTVFMPTGYQRWGIFSLCDKPLLTNSTSSQWVLAAGGKNRWWTDVDQVLITCLLFQVAVVSHLHSQPVCHLQEIRAGMGITCEPTRFHHAHVWTRTIKWQVMWRRCANWNSGRSDKATGSGLSGLSFSVINFLKPNGTYMYHLLQQYVSLRFVFIGFVLFPL
jgi:hypothetical protein